MEENKETAQSTHRKRRYAVKVSLLLLVFFLIISLGLLEDKIWFHFAQEKAQNNEYFSAIDILDWAEDENSELLKKYANLRIEINNKYPDLLIEYDKETLERWRDEFSELQKHSAIFNKRLSEQISRLRESLDLICKLYEEYYSVQDMIYETMDVFSEMNRLYTKADDGKNVVFTVEEENEKAQNWMSQNETISNIAGRIPGYENSYLLNYLIKEIRSECEEIMVAMRKVLEGGYAATDKVRLSGGAQKAFPDIESNDNKTANVTRKDEYISLMNYGINRILVQSLAEFYTVGINE